MYACFQEQGLAFVIVMKMARLPVAALPESRLKNRIKSRNVVRKKRKKFKVVELPPSFSKQLQEDQFINDQEHLRC